MIIYGHAVRKYIERILNIEESQVGNNVKNFIRKQIRKAYENPDKILSVKTDMPPVYVKGEVALIVANKKEMNNGESKYTYVTDGGEIIIPTVYHVDTFVEKHDIPDSQKQRSFS